MRERSRRDAPGRVRRVASDAVAREPASRVVATGAVAMLARADPEALVIRPRFFAELEDGTRVHTDKARHVGATDVADAIKERAGLLTWREYLAGWSPVGFVLGGGLAETRMLRRDRWDPLIRALGEHGHPATKRMLDRLPFQVDLSEELRERLADPPT